MNVALLGAKGKVNRAIEGLIKEKPDRYRLVGRITGGKLIDGVPTYRNLKKLLEENKWLKGKDYLTIIDFSHPDWTLDIIDQIKKCKKRKILLTIGTTGFSEEEIKVVNHFMYKTRRLCIKSPNYDMEFLIWLREQMELFEKAYTHYRKNKEVSILAVHPMWKKDIPSGTTLGIKEWIDEITFDKEKQVFKNKGPAEMKPLFSYNSDLFEYFIIEGGVIGQFSINGRRGFALGALEISQGLISCDELKIGVPVLDDLASTSRFVKKYGKSEVTAIVKEKIETRW